MGVHFFDSAFNPEKTKEEMDFQEWVVCWLRYLDGDEGEQSGKSDRAEEEDDDIGGRSEGPQSSHGNKRREDSDAAKGKSLSAAREEATRDQNQLWIVRQVIEAYRRMRHTPITPLFGDD